MDELKKFWKRVVRGKTKNSCWDWTGAKLPSGYGFLTDNQKIDGRWVRKTVYAHRLSYEIHHGPIPEGYYVMHKCDNPPCPNPDHLFAGTPQANVDDMIAKGRHPGIPQPEDSALVVTRLARLARST